MTENRKISEIYQETIESINKLKPDMTIEKQNEIFDIILKNRDYLGITFNPRLMSLDRIKELNIDIIDNIELASRDSKLVKLRKLKRKMDEEPSFIKQFNFK